MNSELSRPNNPLTPSLPWYGYATVVSRSQQVAALRATLIAVALLTALVLVIWV